MKDRNQAAKEMSLMLLYLLSWEEGPKGMEYRRSWKGYDFGILDELEEEGLIYGNHKAKSVALDASAVEQAKALLKQYGVAE
jgi:hypothetical protein